MKISKNALLPQFERQTDYFDYFSGSEVPDVQQLQDKRLKAGLQKTYLLETVDGGNAGGGPSLAEIFQRSEIRIDELSGDDGVHALYAPSGERVAVLEEVDSRYLALYTLLPSVESDKLVKDAVAANPFLDHLWLSSQSFLTLWTQVLRDNNNKRYGKITFEHESIYETHEGDEEYFQDERRTSRFTMVDKLEVISQKMDPLSQEYAPLASITQLRIPAQGRGGHDLYYDGKLTNRSSSFLDHRATVRGVVDLYRALTKRVEEQLWVSASGPHGIADGNFGSIAEIVFSKTLPEDLFKRWVISLFNNRRNRFRVTGYPTWLSDRKVHANAIDQHLWQPLVLEMTPERVIAVLPHGTCGNSINRLVSNIQRFVDPKVTAYIGDQEYGALIQGVAV
ncbi:hypothetical protein [Streptomyces physcomitrii]|uniref:Uncharacterized protein n=1 Tax=Streptomyces physcomitrii TaxID=2724184 RepID=A0ABX1H2R8_9ACTN|nr:hypothetical protein [Streptomyces physcomitrii]NKI41554.1 hypothetical protein [Streptomyces physcomitrii]